MNQADALRAACPHFVGRWSNQSIITRASQYAQRPDVKAFIELEIQKREQRRRDLEAHILSRTRKRAFLGAIVDSHILPEPETAHFRVHDPLAAVKIDNEMTGDNAPVKVEGEVTLGIIMANLRGTTGLPAANEMAAGEAMAFDLPRAAVETVREPAPAPLPPAPAPTNGHGNGHAHLGSNGSPKPPRQRRPAPPDGNGHGNGHARKYAD